MNHRHRTMAGSRLDQSDLRERRRHEPEPCERGTHRSRETQGERRCRDGIRPRPSREAHVPDGSHRRPGPVRMGIRGGGTRTSASGDRSGGDICKQNGPAGPTLPSGSGSGPSIHEHVGTVGSSHRPSLPLSKHCCCPSGTPGKEGNPISAFVDVVKSSPAKPGVSHRFRRDWTAYRRTDSLYPSG